MSTGVQKARRFFIILHLHFEIEWCIVQNIAFKHLCLQTNRQQVGL